MLSEGPLTLRQNIVQNWVQWVLKPQNRWNFLVRTTSSDDEIVNDKTWNFEVQRLLPRAVYRRFTWSVVCGQKPHMRMRTSRGVISGQKSTTNHCTIFTICGFCVHNSQIVVKNLSVDRGQNNKVWSILGKSRSHVAKKLRVRPSLP